MWDNQAGSQKWLPTPNASDRLNSDSPVVETKSNTRNTRNTHKHTHPGTCCAELLVTGSNPGQGGGIVTYYG